MKRHFVLRKTFFPVRVVNTRAGWPGCCGVCIRGDAQNPPGHSPEQPAGARGWTGRLQRCLHALRFDDSKGSCAPLCDQRKARSPHLTATSVQCMRDRWVTFTPMGETVDTSQEVRSRHSRAIFLERAWCNLVHVLGTWA